MQKLYNKVYKNKDGLIVQAMIDLPSVIQDEKATMKAASLIGIENFGPSNAFILNKDLDCYSITHQDTKDFLY